MTSKRDLKKELPSYRARAGTWADLEVPRLSYLAIDGAGSPAGDSFAAAVAALYPVAYAAKFSSKAAGRDYVVPPLEGLWFADDLSAFARRDKEQWRWTLLLLTPAWVDDAAVAAAVEATRAKKGPAPAMLDEVEHRTLDEGRCLQTLHVGSFDSEGPVLSDLHERVIPQRGLEPTGHHHEIYLSDLRRTAPGRLRTILRQPVRAATAQPS